MNKGRWVLPVAVIMSGFLLSCINNGNQVKIVNLAQGSILINFRAETTQIAGNGGKTTIRDIPNGTYSYSTTYSLPPGATSYSVEGLAAAGELTFSYSSTEYLLLYSSTLVDGNYTLSATLSESVPTNYHP